MAVARTYEKYPFDGEPFKENGRTYIYIVMPKGKKKVRWYSDAERARMDKTAGLKPAVNDVMGFNARHAFGFDEDGYIYVYAGDKDEIDKWADENHECTRRNLTFGVYTPSRLTIQNLPSTIKAVKLDWESVADEGDRMKPHEEVIKIVDKLTAPFIESKSTFQGAKDGWLKRKVTVKHNKKMDSIYGEKHIHTLVDDDENVYVWDTSSKDIPTGTTVYMQMKVKDHKVIKGVNTTLVYYCKII